MKRTTPLPYATRPDLLHTFTLLVDTCAPQLLAHPELLDRLPALFSLIIHADPPPSIK